MTKNVFSVNKRFCFSATLLNWTNLWQTCTIKSWNFAR